MTQLIIITPTNRIFESHMRCKFWKNKSELSKTFFNTMCTSCTSTTKEAAESDRRKTLNKPINQINVTGVSVFSCGSTLNINHKI